MIQVGRCPSSYYYHIAEAGEVINGGIKYVHLALTNLPASAVFLIGY